MLLVPAGAGRTLAPSRTLSHGATMPVTASGGTPSQAASGAHALRLAHLPDSEAGAQAGSVPVTLTPSL